MASPRSRHLNWEAEVFQGEGNSECKGPGGGHERGMFEGQKAMAERESGRQ